MTSYTLTGFRMDEFKNVNVKGYIGIYDLFSRSEKNLKKIRLDRDWNKR